MSKIVTDADGVIKLGMSGTLAALLSVAEVLVPEAVYQESVPTGKREMYEDAFELERELREGGAKVIRAGENEQAERLLEDAPALGPGEPAALRVAYESGVDVILTDERAFHGFLARAGMGALVPAVASVLLDERGAESVEGAVEALGSIEGSIHSEVHEAAMKDLAGMREERGWTMQRRRAYSLYLRRIERADERTRTADLLITSDPSGVAGGCTRLQYPYI